MYTMSTEGVSSKEKGAGNNSDPSEEGFVFPG
jgi:hypothetical protein